jgi:hypothetical protein
VSEQESVDESPQPAQVSSLAAKLRAQRHETASEITHELTLPGYGGNLIAVYELKDPKWAGDISTRVFKTTKKDDDRALIVAATEIASACAQIKVLDDDGADVTERELGSAPVRYDNALAEYLGFPTSDKARDIVLGVFAGRGFRVIDHAQELLAWMGSSNRALLEELLGED